MKLLLTGFDPFGGEPINPAWEAVKRVSDQVGDVEVVNLWFLQYSTNLSIQ